MPAWSCPQTVTASKSALARNGTCVERRAAEDLLDYLVPALEELNTVGEDIFPIFEARCQVVWMERLLREMKKGDN